MSNTPLVSIIMPVHNGAKYISASIQSILDQTYSHFEFLIGNDGSTDQTVAIIQSFKDPRIRLLSNPSNQGIVNTLNRLVSVAQGEYLARLDADDLALPERLAHQVEYMQSHPDVAALGSSAEVIDENDQVINHLRAASGSLLAYNYWRPTPILHPSVMLRRSTMLSYDQAAAACEDYDLFLRLSKKHRLANLPEVLIKYRQHTSSLTGKLRGQINPVVFQRFQEAFPRLSLDEARYWHLVKRNSPSTAQYIRDLNLVRTTLHLSFFYFLADIALYIKKRIFTHSKSV